MTVIENSGSSEGPSTVDEPPLAARGLERLDEIRVVAPGEQSVPDTVVDAVVASALAAIESLAAVDPADLDAPVLDEFALGVECVRRRITGVATSIVDHVERAAPFQADGFFRTRAWSTHRLQLSGPEAHRRIRTARLQHRVPLWANACAQGLVGVAQSELMARIAANPRISDHLLQRDRFDLLADAVDLPYNEFERRARTWEALADPHGDHSRTERQKAARDFRASPRPEGGWTLTGSLDELAGSEFVEIFAHFVDAEWRIDWAEAHGRRFTARRKSAWADRQRLDRRGHLRSHATGRNHQPTAIPRRRDAAHRPVCLGRLRPTRSLVPGRPLTVVGCARAHGPTVTTKAIGTPSIPTATKSPDTAEYPGSGAGHGHVADHQAHPRRAHG